MPDGGFDEVRPATLNSARCFWHFNRSGIGPHTACTGTPGAGSAAGADPASATASNSIDIVSDVHGLLGRLRYPSYELPKRLCCCRTYHGHPESRWQCALHPQLHHPTARLQTDVHQAAAVDMCHRCAGSGSRTVPVPQEVRILGISSALGGCGVRGIRA